MSKKRPHTEDEEFEPTDDERASSFGGSTLKKLREELKVCREERMEYLTGWQRARADLINERAEHQKRDEGRTQAVLERLITDLLPVLDSFDMAFANRKTWESIDENWRRGVEHIHNHLLSVLASYDITPFAPVGETFNPAEHEPIETRSVNQKKHDGKILEVRGKGYRRGDVILRPAKVVVGAFDATKSS